MVAGGAGFLGSNLCKKLLDLGYEVICVDNLLTGFRENIEDLQKNPNFKFIEFDVTNGLPEDLVADEVYHLASPASPNIHSPKSYHALPFETMLVNTQGTWKLCEFALKQKAKLLYTSSSEAYGDPLEHPQTEEYKGNVSTTGPRSVYDEAKRFGETIVAAFVRSKGLDGRIVRPFNTYGPHMAVDDGRLVIEFIKAALKNEPFPVFGDGTQTRSFCYVDDLIEGFYKAMTSPNTTGQVYNLGNPGEFTVLELAEVLKRITTSSSEIEFKEALPKDDPLKRRPDISKSKTQLNWEPKVPLEEGLKKFIDYLQTTAKL